MTIALVLMREIAVMAMMIALGVYTKKRGVFTEDTARRLSDFILSIVFPLMLVNTLQGNIKPHMRASFWTMMAMSLFIMTLMPLISTFAFRKKEGSDNYRIDRIAASMPNCGFMGVPLLLASTGEETIIYSATAIGTFQLMSWVWAVPLMEKKKPNLKQCLINPGVLAFLTGITLFALHIRLPDVILSGLTHISALNTPIAMIMTGIYLADVSVKELFNDISLYKPVIFKNIVFPVISLIFVIITGVTARYGKAFSLTFVIMFSCSCAASVLLLPLRSGMGGARASKLVAVSTLFAVITIPAIIFIADKIL